MPEMKHISVAPMMDWTDRHCRYFHRLIAPSVILYTEMVTTGAILNGDQERLLGFDRSEHPIALQLGGCDPADLAESAKIGADYGYDEINLNCGCPSERVQKGSFGACLMAEPDLVARGMEAMAKAVSIPVTVKCRIGIDDVDDAPFLDKFVTTLKNAGCSTFIIHARKAILKGLSPKENRSIPPLRYELVREIKAKYPELEIIINGGIKSIDQIHSFTCFPRDNGGLKAPAQDPRRSLPRTAIRGEESTPYLDGVMIGREAYQNPWFLRELETEIFHTSDLLNEAEILERMTEYAARMAKDYDTPIKSVTRHMTGLFSGQRGARTWRQSLSTLPHQDGATADVIRQAYHAMQQTQRSGAA